METSLPHGREKQSPKHVHKSLYGKTAPNIGNMVGPVSSQQREGVPMLCQRA